MTQAVEQLNRRMLRARDAIDRTYAQPLDIEALAGVAFVSEAHFIRTFRSTFGETPHRYLQRRRVERAMFLLRETNRAVTDICLDVGFASLGTFSRTFHDIVGLTAHRLPRADRHHGRPHLLHDGLDKTEQFWRSALEEWPIASDATPIPKERDNRCSTRSTSRTFSFSTRTRRSTSTLASSALRSAVINSSDSCAG